MSRLPRLAVLIEAGAVSQAPSSQGPSRANAEPQARGYAGAAALVSLVDSGLDAIAVVAGGAGLAARAAARELGEFGLVDRLTVLPEPLVLRAGPGGRRPFTVLGGTPQHGPEQLPDQDAIVLVGRHAAIGPALRGTPAGPPPPPELAREAGGFFGGVFHPELEGVFRVSPDPELAGPQGRWIGEYVRGRYLLPSRSVMVCGAGRLAGLPWRGGLVSRPDGQAASRRYLRALAKEIRRGHARASRAGYPLPVPAGQG
ncbi:hypothetical protein [Parafrankia elaeagni]|uniref:hypothetical protein n=1 Tax=Parafrankia elaeagni TaxID=222534 RepID=UPI0003A152BF|nr:hypothetical protein [Parafrankia elaeagni]